METYDHNDLDFLIPSVPKPLKALLLSLAVSDLGVGILHGSSIVHHTSRPRVASRSHKLSNFLHSLYNCEQSVRLCFVLRCSVFKLGQILGDPSTPQVPGTCDL